MENIENSKSLRFRLYVTEKFFSRMLSLLNVSGTFLKNFISQNFCENLIIRAKLKGFMQGRITFAKKFMNISLFQERTHKIAL